MFTERQGAAKTRSRHNTSRLLSETRYPAKQTTRKGETRHSKTAWRRSCSSISTAPRSQRSVPPERSEETPTLVRSRRCRPYPRSSTTTSTPNNNSCSSRSQTTGKSEPTRRKPLDRARPWPGQSSCLRGRISTNGLRCTSWTSTTRSTCCTARSPSSAPRQRAPG